MTEREKIGSVYRMLRASCDGYGWRSTEEIHDLLQKTGVDMTFEQVRAEIEYLYSLGAVQTIQGLWKPR
jgi:hypothetical protein